MYTERLKQLEELSIPSQVNKRPRPSSPVKDGGDSGSREEEEVGTTVCKTNCNNETSKAPNYEVAGLGIGFASMVAEVLLSHPFIVIRNQCQVRSNSIALHLFPFSLVLIVSKCVHNQGFTFLWKGLGSVFVVKGLCFISENVISEMTSLPKEVSRLSSLRRIGAHLLLRTLSWILVTPFYAASVVELVQSEKASEPTTLISCFRSGFYRLFHLPHSPRIGSPGPLYRGGSAIRSLPLSTSRLLPIWQLIPPVVFLNVGHYVVRSVACVLAGSYWGGDEDRLERDAEHYKILMTGGMSHSRFRTFSQSSLDRKRAGISHRSEELPLPDAYALAQQRQETALQSIYNRYYTDLLCSMTANCIADIITYPLETLVIRLCVQGTRTLVDNMDTGDVVVPVVSAYEGFFDAARTATDSPIGTLGLYRGFGALIAQYAVQAAFLYGIRSLYQHLLYLWPPSVQPSQSVQAKPAVYDHPDQPSGDHPMIRTSTPSY